MAAHVVLRVRAVSGRWPSDEAGTSIREEATIEWYGLCATHGRGSPILPYTEGARENHDPSALNRHDGWHVPGAAQSRGGEARAPRASHAHDCCVRGVWRMVQF